MSAKAIKKMNQAAVEVDEYTAKMDRMVMDLKKRSDEDRVKRAKTMLLFIGIGLVITAVSIFIMLNTGMSDWNLGFISKSR
ncbi:MAG: hypothetical protein AB1656_08495 [Candidatus Omnitrophota bacterium]